MRPRGRCFSTPWTFRDVKMTSVARGCYVQGVLIQAHRARIIAYTKHTGPFFAARGARSLNTCVGQMIEIIKQSAGA
ncbi:hypothetical protein J6590_089286, partial [Homalodisca vitripennis]